MAFPPQLSLATRNPGKIREIRRICADWPVRWVVFERGDHRWPDVEETGATYLENAILKARTVAEALALPALADDSGIEVDALGGAPGPRSARFAGPRASEEENLQLLIERFSPVWRWAADVFGVLAIMLFGGVLIQQGWKLVELGQFQQTPVMGLSKAYVYASMPVGGALVILYSLRHLWRAVTGAPTAVQGH